MTILDVAVRLLPGGLIAAFALAIGGCAASLPDTETPRPPEIGERATTEAESPDTLGEGSSSLLRHRNATISTGFDTYVVRDVTFNTGEGFGSGQGLTGFNNGTLWEFKIRFVKSIEVVGKIDASEAQRAPNNYFVRDEIELRRTFRTRVVKTDGERVEFVVRINEIHGTLESGGPLLLTREEIETLRKIEFF